MKQQSKKKYAGVWLDNQKAFIIANASEMADSDYAITEKIKAADHLGSGSEHSMNNAKKSDNVKFFKSVSGMLLNYDEILIFGPGKSQEQLKNLLDDDAQFANRKITIDSAGQLTDPQMIAKVRDFFG